MHKKSFWQVVRPWGIVAFLGFLSSGVYAQSINPRDLGQKMASTTPPVVFDVRDQLSFSRSSLPGAVNIAWNGATLPEGFRDRISAAAQEVIVVCQDGTRSKAAAAYLAVQGYSNVSYLEGGLAAWGNSVPTRMTTWGVIKVLFGNNYRHKQG